MRYITESNINYQVAILQPERFKIINMGKEIWLIDSHFSEYKKALKTALKVAKMFGNKTEQRNIEKLLNKITKK